jgi:delta14-sterol reductase
MLPPLQAPTSSKAKPHYEFMGPPGALGTMVALPLLCVALPVVCNTAACPPTSVDALKAALPGLEDLVKAEAFAVTLVWFLLHVVLHLVVPGPVVDGTPVRGLNGAKLKYHCNGA